MAGLLGAAMIALTRRHSALVVGRHEQRATQGCVRSRPSGDDLGQRVAVR
jgi:hypothetical protein